MAAGFVLAVASDGQVGLVGHSRQQLREVSRFRRGHMLAVRPGERRPTLVGPRVRERSRHHIGWRRELGKPDVEVVQGREILLWDSAGRAANRPDAQAFPAQARRAQSDDVKCHGTCG